MNQIKCPNCGEVFTIDESDYAYIVDQIRNHEFENELRKREAALEEKLNMQLQVLKTQYENEKNVLGFYFSFNPLIEVKKKNNIDNQSVTIYFGEVE